MLCQKCQQHPATVFFSQTVGNQTSQFHLCENCAKEQGAAIHGGMNLMNFNPLAALSDILNSVMAMQGNPMPGMAPGREPQATADPQLQCPDCGYQLSVFRQTGRLGCTKCYQSFRAALEPVITGIHGAARQVEESPVSSEVTSTDHPKDSTKPEVSLLREKMKEAIKNEKFEEAARLRDEIKTIEGK